MKILIAVNAAGFQIVNVASNLDEARQMAETYLMNGDGDSDLCPEYFELHERDDRGSFTKITRIDA